MLAAHVTTYKVHKPAAERPWFGVGPVTDPGGRFAGVAFTIGNLGVALHRHINWLLR